MNSMSMGGTSDGEKTAQVRPSLKSCLVACPEIVYVKRYLSAVQFCRSAEDERASYSFLIKKIPEKVVAMWKRCMRSKAVYKYTIPIRPHILELDSRGHFLDRLDIGCLVIPFIRFSFSAKGPGLKQIFPVMVVFFSPAKLSACICG